MSKSLIAGCGRLVCVALALSAALLLCSLNAAAATEKVLYTFQGGTDGDAPNGGLISDAAGNLYGTTIAGGSTACTQGCGTAFELLPDGLGGWTKKTLYAFRGGADGEEPTGGLAFDQAGNLYGTTYVGGGRLGAGTVYELSPQPGGSWAEKILYSFADKTDGENPVFNVVFDTLGNLYGVTARGPGNRAYGTVFELSPNPHSSWTEHTLHIFPIGSVRDGYGPYAPLLIDAAGNLYGTTTQGGPSRGCVFELSPTSGGWVEHILHFFSVGTDGWEPIAALSFDAAGNLYGTTTAGGTYNFGVVYELVPSSKGSWNYRIIHEFGPYAGGLGADSSVLVDGSGNLYGTTSGGGAVGCTEGGCGTAFELSPHVGYWTFNVLVDFSLDVDGGYPRGGLMFDASGNLYGATQGGSGTVAYYGAVFEIIP